MSSRFGVGGSDGVSGSEEIGESDGVDASGAFVTAQIRDFPRGHVLFVGVAAALVAATAMAMVGESPTLVVTLFWLLGPTAALLTTAVVLWWAAQNDRDSAYLRHVAGWAAAGAVVLGLSGGVAMYIQHLHGIGVLRAGAVVPVLQWGCGGFVIGSVVGVYSAGRRVRERQLRRERRKAENLAETLSVLNRVLRHDIRNDVNVVEGYVDLIAEDAGADAEDHVAVVREHTARIVQFAEYARETERLVAEGNAGVRTLDVVERVADVCRDVESAFPEATVATEFPASAEVRAHRLVDSAFENLVENAVVHNPDDSPEVRVSVERDGDFVSVVVSDDGPGIPDDEVAVLESGTESALEHSDGMGLWLVNWIVTYSGGEVEFAENEPTGSRISVRLPAADG